MTTAKIIKKESRLPSVSIIVVNYHSEVLLKECLLSLRDLKYPQNRLQMICVNNDPDDTLLQFVKSDFPHVSLIKNPVNNYCLANNLGIRQAKGKYAVCLNPDTKMDPNWLIHLVEAMETHPKVAMAGGKVLFFDGRLQSAGQMELPHGYWMDRGLGEVDQKKYDVVEFVPSVSNCAAIYRKEAFDEVGGFDEDFVMYMEDVDVAYRLRQKGWQVLYIPSGVVWHKLHGSGQTSQDHDFYCDRNRLLFFAKHQPEKLLDLFFGNGILIRLPKPRFHQALLAVLHKLLQCHDLQRASAIFKQLSTPISHVVNLEKIELDSVLGTRIRESQQFQKDLRDQQEIIRDQNGRIHELGAQVRIRDEKLELLERNYEKVFEEFSRQAQAFAEVTEKKEGDIRLLESEIQNLQQKVREKESILARQNQTLQETGKKADVLEKHLAERSGELAAQVRIRDEKLELLERNYEKVFEEFSRQAQAFAEVTEKKEGDIRLLESEIQNLQQKMRERESIVAHQDQELRDRENKAQELGEKMRAQEAQIGKLQNEISGIFESETYRLFVRPILWPCFSFAKKIAWPYQALVNKNGSLPVPPVWKRRPISILDFHSLSTRARCSAVNEYFVSIKNVSLRERKLKLVIDIGPYIDRVYPHRSYAYFATLVTLQAQSQVQIRANYDWDKQAKFWIQDQELPVIDLWRGTLKSLEMYTIDVLCHDQTGGSLIGKASIIQMLKQ